MRTFIVLRTAAGISYEGRLGGMRRQLLVSSVRVILDSHPADYFGTDGTLLRSSFREIERRKQAWEAGAYVAYQSESYPSSMSFLHT